MYDGNGSMFCNIHAMLWCDLGQVALFNLPLFIQFSLIDRDEDGSVVSPRCSPLMMSQRNECAGHRNALGQGAYSTLPWLARLYKRASGVQFVVVAVAMPG